MYLLAVSKRIGVFMKSVSDIFYVVKPFFVTVNQFQVDNEMKLSHVQVRDKNFLHYKFKDMFDACCTTNVRK